MAISFPTSPVLNDTYTVGNKTWIWNGYAWDLVTVDLKPFSDTSNAAYAVANSAYDKANAANVFAYNTGIGANAYSVSVGNSANNYAGFMANSANGYAASLTPDLSPAFNKANDAYTQANAAYSHANDVATGANAYSVSVGASGNAYVNVSTGATNAYSVTVGAASNAYTNTVGASANSWANTKLSNTSGVTFDGSLTISNNLTVANNVSISNNISNVTQIVFNTSTNITPTQPSALTWSQDDSTLHFNMDSPGSVIGHIGQDLFYYAKNQTGSTITKGTVVRFAGTSGASGRLLIAPAIANNSYPSKYTMGVTASNINNGDDGFVIAQGKVRQIDTSMFSAGDILYVSPSTPGGFSNTIPSAPNNKIAIAAVVHNSATVGTIEVRLTLGSELNENEQIEFSNLTEGDILYYVNANGRFENRQTLVSVYDTANAAFTAGNTTAISANNYAGSMANAANAYANTVGSSSNAYAVTVGASGNSWSNTVGASANSYTNTSVAASNTWANTVGASANGYTDSSVAFVNAYVNTSTTSANNYAGAMANGAGAIANAAFAAANQAGSVANSANTYGDSTYVKKAGDTITGDLVVQGNVTISGITTYANTQTLLIGDNIFVLNADLPGAVAPSENAGIEVNRGSSSNVSLVWDEGNDKWTFTNDGTTYVSIASNTDVASANNYAGAMANAVNAYAASVGVSTNNYTSATYATQTSLSTGLSSANGWANSIGTNANTYSDSLLVTGRAYTNTSTDSANNYAGAMANAANAYAASLTPDLSPVFVVANGAYDKANSANVLAYNTGIGANAYSDLVGLSSNNYAGVMSNGAGTIANAAFDRANTVHDKVNTAIQNGSSFIVIGDSGILSSNVTTSTTSDQILDTFSTSNWRSANYIVTMNSGTSYHTTQITVLQDGSTAYMTEYATIFTDSSLASFSVGIDSGTVRLNVTPTNAATTLRLIRTTNK